MTSKLLIKLIDQAIVPAILLLMARIVSVFLFVSRYDVNMSLGSRGFVFEKPAEYLIINTYSLLVMLIVVTIGVVYVLVKAHVLHDTHILPHLTARIFSLRMSGLIQSTFDIYSQATVWMSYMYLLFFVVGLMVFLDAAQVWLFYVTLALTVLTSVLFVNDVERELKMVDHPETDDLEDEEEFVLRMGTYEEV